MRYINTSHINPPNNWVDLAREQNRTADYPPTTSLWSYFKSQLEGIVGKKCWYSESLNIGSINPIDHFRPKAARIKELPKFEQLKDVLDRININSGNGYPFLIHEFSNYRYACGRVNSPIKHETKDKLSRGKWDYFPIKINTTRATTLDERASEEICFIDPCIQEDTELLTFTDIGTIQAHKSVLEAEWEYCKVLVSIEVYHLHYYEFCEVRKEVWKDCAKEIRLSTRLYEKNPKTDEEQENFSDRIEKLVILINKKTQFSAVAIDCIRFYKSQPAYAWLNIFFTDKNLKK